MRRARSARRRRRPQSDSPKGIHKRRQDERQHHRQRNGDEDVLSDIQGRDDNRSHGDCDERSEFRRRGGGNGGRGSERRKRLSCVRPLIVARQLLLTRHRHNVLQGLGPPPSGGCRCVGTGSQIIPVGIRSNEIWTLSTVLRWYRSLSRRQSRAVSLACKSPDTNESMRRALIEPCDAA